VSTDKIHDHEKKRYRLTKGARLQDLIVVVVVQRRTTTLQPRRTNKDEREHGTYHGDNGWIQRDNSKSNRKRLGVCLFHNRKGMSLLVVETTTKSNAFRAIHGGREAQRSQSKNSLHVDFVPRATVPPAKWLSTY